MSKENINKKDKQRFWLAINLQNIILVFLLCLFISFLVTCVEVSFFYMVTKDVPDIVSVSVFNTVYIIISVYVTWVLLDVFAQKIMSHSYTKQILIIGLGSAILNIVLSCMLHILADVVGYITLDPTKMYLEMIINSLLIPCGVVFVVQFYKIYYENVNRTNAGIKSQMLQLQNRLQPHFFFNALNTLLGMVVSKDEKAEDYIVKLTEFYKITLQEPSIIKLDEELKTCNKFTELESIRLNKEIDLKWNNNLDVLNYGLCDICIPSLLIQSILEPVIAFIEENIETSKIEFNGSVEHAKNHINIKIISKDVISYNFDLLDNQSKDIVQTNKDVLTQYFGNSADITIENIHEQYVMIFISYPFIVC